MNFLEEKKETIFEKVINFFFTKFGIVTTLSFLTIICEQQNPGIFSELIIFFSKNIDKAIK